MYQSFEIRNFRCFGELTISNLEKVNLVAGVNNVGKTALLEALFFHCGAYNPGLAVKIDAFRGIDLIKVEIPKKVQTPWDSLFSGFDSSMRVELIGKNDLTGLRVIRLKLIHQPQELAKIARFVEHGPEKSQIISLSMEAAQVLELEYEEQGKHGEHYLILDQKGLRTDPLFPPPPPFPAFFLAARFRIPPTEEAELFGKLEIIGQQEVLLNPLRVIEPRLQRLAVVVTRGVPMLHGDIGLDRLVPLPVMGEGMDRLASLILHIGNAPNGIVLIDEMENGLHHSILSKVWRAIGEVARQFNTQVFATTHSLECIMAAHKAFTESEHYDFRLHRLERAKETIQAVTYDQETLEAAIETGLEVR